MLCRWANCQFSGYGKEEGSPQEAPQWPEGALQNTAQLFWWRDGLEGWPGVKETTR